MENLTHTLTGLMLSRAGLNRWCPLATPILLLASNAPDVDIVYRLGGSLTYLDHHREISHAFSAIPVFAALITLGVRYAGHRPLPLLRGMLTAGIGILIHLLLDWTNTYGVRMLFPFSGAWLRLDITNIVDLWIWAVLALAVAGPLLSQLVSSEIGARKGTGRSAAIFALTAILIYSGIRFVLHERALATLESHLYEGRPPRRVEAYPHFANPFAWNTIVDTGDAFILQPISLLADYDPTGGKVYYQPQPSPALNAARATQTVQRYLRFAQVVFWKVTPSEKLEGGVKVEASDLRFGDPSAPRFVATVVLDANLRPVEENFTYGILRPR